MSLFVELLTKNRDTFKYMYQLRNEHLLYDRITRYVSDKNVIDTTNEIFKHYNTFAPKITGKEVLTAYVIALLPEYVLSVKKSDISSELGYIYQTYMAANNLIEQINDLCSGSGVMEKFVPCVITYQECFHMFMEVDRARSISELVHYWCDTKKTLDEIPLSEKYKNNPGQKKQVLEAISNTQRTIERNIKRFDKNFDMSKLRSYYELQKKVTNNVKKAFFDKLEQEIEREDYTGLGRLMGEIRDQVLMLQTQSPRMQEEFREYFDVELIQQMIQYSAFSGEQYMAYVKYVIDILAKLAAPIKTPVIKAKWKEMEQKIISGEIPGYSKIVPYTFKYIYNLIAEIKDDIITCDVMLSMGINIFA